MANQDLPQGSASPQPEFVPPTGELPALESPSLPELTPPPLPTEGRPLESAGVAGTLYTESPPPGAEGAPQSDFPVWGWAGVGLAVGLVLGAALAALLCRRKRRPDPVPATGPVSGPSPIPATGAVPAPPPVRTANPEPPRIEKLHEQGARSSQQDCFSVSPDELSATHGRLAVVADGMGGLADGDKVSQAVVTAIMNGFYGAAGAPDQVLLTLLRQAVQAVDSLLGPDGFQHSGSTLVAGLIRNGAFHYLSVGDSRIYLYRGGVLYQLNREHIFRNELYVRAVNGAMSFQEAARHPKGGGLTSFLGMGPLKYVDLPAQPVAVLPGDCFLLMSDGVYNALLGGELEAVLRENEGRMADALRDAIQAKGYSNQDNYTAVILHC